MTNINNSDTQPYEYMKEHFPFSNEKKYKHNTMKLNSIYGLLVHPVADSDKGRTHEK